MNLEQDLQRRLHTTVYRLAASGSHHRGYESMSQAICPAQSQSPDCEQHDDQVLPRRCLSRQDKMCEHEDAGALVIQERLHASASCCSWRAT